MANFNNERNLLLAEVRKTLSNMGVTWGCIYTDKRKTFEFRSKLTRIKITEKQLAEISEKFPTLRIEIKTGIVRYGPNRYSITNLCIYPKQ